MSLTPSQLVCHQFLGFRVQVGDTPSATLEILKESYNSSQLQHMHSPASRKIQQATLLVALLGILKGPVLGYNLITAAVGHKTCQPRDPVTDPSIYPPRDPERPYAHL